MREDIQKALDKAAEKGRYLIGITYLDKGRLEHQAFTEDFPKVDIVKSANKQRDLFKGIYARETDSGKDQL